MYPPICMVVGIAASIRSGVQNGVICTVSIIRPRMAAENMRPYGI